MAVDDYQHTLNETREHWFTYDAENRLTTISDATSASFGYDADGTRVKSVLNGVTTYYVGNHVEWTTFGAVCQTPAPARWSSMTTPAVS